MTEAEKRACLKYQKKQGQINIRIKPEILAKYKAAAEKANMSFRAFVLMALEKAYEE